MMYKNYTHLKCECGGIIGMYDKENFACERCGKVYLIGNQGKSGMCYWRMKKPDGYFR